MMSDLSSSGLGGQGRGSGWQTGLQWREEHTLCLTQCLSSSVSPPVSLLQCLSSSVSPPVFLLHLLFTFVFSIASIFISLSHTNICLALSPSVSHMLLKNDTCDSHLLMERYLLLYWSLGYGLYIRRAPSPSLSKDKHSTLITNKTKEIKDTVLAV